MVKNSFVVSVALLMVSAGVVYAAEGAGKQKPVKAAQSSTEQARIIKDQSSGVELVLVKGGCYQMGDATGEGGPEEKPVHEVCVDDFYIGTYEVTQGQWKKIMGTNPSSNSSCGDTCPVDNVSWYDAKNFIDKLNNLNAASKKQTVSYRLPTEAEWEYAARSGGKKETFAGGGGVEEVAWYSLNSTGISPVGGKKPNGLGLYDMSGNVWEWTIDIFAADYYAKSPRTSPKGAASGDRRVLRGGSYGEYPFDLRTSYRNYLPPAFNGEGKGFRLAGVPLKRGK